MPPASGKSFERLIATMHRLRSPGGCPWDAEQTHESLKPYVIEEAHEVCEAIDSGADRELLEELGDLLLQIVFHAELASERNAFAITDVVDQLVAKLVRRHPHVFAGTTASSPDEVLANWQRIKLSERQSRADGESGLPQAGTLDGVPRGMPALLRAHRLGQRAAAAGFDWRLSAAVRAKIEEELGELRAAEESANVEAVAEEIGDLLFAISSYARHWKLEAETLLHRSLDSFCRRFSLMERHLVEQGKALDTAGDAALEEAWRGAKESLIKNRP